MNKNEQCINKNSNYKKEVDELYKKLNINNSNRVIRTSLNEGTIFGPIQKSSLPLSSSCKSLNFDDNKIV